MYSTYQMYCILHLLFLNVKMLVDVSVEEHIHIKIDKTVRITKNVNLAKL